MSLSNALVSFCTVLIFLPACASTARRPAAASPQFRITFPKRSVPGEPRTATIEILDHKTVLRADGKPFVRAESYFIPYIQTGPDLHIQAECGDCAAEIRIRYTLQAKGGVPFQVETSRDKNFAADFTGLAKGEYTLVAKTVSADDHESVIDQVEHIGIGDIIVAIGDSLTEGFYGDKCAVPTIHDWTEAPPNSLSLDRRNFCQFGPRGDLSNFPYNYKTSWLTDLNNRLARALNYPVFILNEGYGGYTASGMLGYITTPEWKARVHVLQPNRWLVHFGVNEALAGIKASDYIVGMRSLIDELTHEYQALPSQIYVAIPSFSTDKLQSVLVTYISPLKQWIADAKLQTGPDFQSFFAQHYRDYYYDFVHPDLKGTAKMAELWATVLGKNHP